MLREEHEDVNRYLKTDLGNGAPLLRPTHRIRPLWLLELRVKAIRRIILIGLLLIL